MCNFVKFYYYLCGMEEFKIFIYALAHLAPLFSAATCAVVVGFSLNNCLTGEEKKLKNTLLTYLLFNSLVWITLFFYTFANEVFYYLSVLCLVANILGPLFYYRTLCNLVSINQEKCFSPLHYVAPALFVVGAVVWVYFIPFEIQEVVKGKIATSTIGFKLVTGTIFVVRASFVLVYFTLFLLQLIRFYRWATNAKNLIRKHTHWMVILIILALFPLYMSLVVLEQRPDAFLAGIGGFLAALGIFVSNIMITYHITRRRYLYYAKTVTSLENEEKPSLSEKPGRRMFSGTLTRERFEEWFRTKKPYLNSDFKITDVVKEMDVNRTVVSSFINKTYGVSFTRYVNRWRIKEYERLLAQYGNEKESPTKLYAQAGFTDPRQYHRAIEAERSVKK